MNRISASSGAPRWGFLLLCPVLLTPLVRLDGIFFGSVVPRAVWLRLAVGVALAVLLALLLLHRCRFVGRDPFLYAFAAFLAIQIVAAVAGDSPQRSVWSGFERMWGVATWAYLLAYYVALRTLVSGAHWRRFLGLSVGVSGLVAALGLLQAAGVWGASLRLGSRITSTLGNPAYLAAYLLLHLGIAAYLFVDAPRRGRRWLAAILLVDAGAFVLTNTLSAWLGVAAGAVCILALYSLWFGGRPARLAWLAAAVVVAAMVAAIALGPSNPLLQGLPPLRRVAELTPDHPSTYGRLLIWSAALQGIADHPWLGVGPENFGVVFSRHFSPGVYAVHRATFADRAHSVLLEAASTSGVLGLLAYLGIWAALVHQLRTTWRRGGSSPAAIIALSSVVLAYLVYLLFWFEDLSSTVAFLSIAAFVSWSASREPLLEVGEPDRRPKRLLLAAFAVFVVAAVTYQRGVRLLLAAGEVPLAMSDETVEAKLARFDGALRRGMPESARAIIPYSAFLEALTPSLPEIRRDAYRIRVVDAATQSALRQMRAIVALDPRNDLWRLENSGLLQFAAIFYGNRAYFAAAQDEVRTAIALSPGRVRHYHSLADAFLTAGETDSAVTTLRRAREVGGDLGETSRMLAKALYLAKDYDGAAEAMLHSAGRPGIGGWDGEELYLPIAAAVERKGGAGRAAQLYARYLELRYGFLEPAAATGRARPVEAGDRAVAGRLPLLYLRAGDRANAALTAQRLMELLPSDQAAFGRFVEALRQGKTDSWEGRASLLADPSATEG